MSNYSPFGDKWEKEISNLPKDELIKMIRELKTGTKDKKICGINTSQEARLIVEGIINDFESGLSTKKETLGLLGEYTARLMELFWVNAIDKIKSNPELLHS